MAGEAWSAASGLLLEAAYSFYGREALWWRGTWSRPAVISFAPADEVTDFSGVDQVVRTHRIRVRRSEIDDPQRGDEISLGAESFKVIGEPTLNRDQSEWTCQAKPIPLCS